MMAEPTLYATWDPVNGDTIQAPEEWPVVAAGSLIEPQSTTWLEKLADPFGNTAWHPHTDGEFPAVRVIPTRQALQGLQETQGGGHITKDSGQRVEFESGMRRDTNEGKPRFDLIQPEGLPYEKQMLTRWAALMRRGADKYGERNWEKARGPEELARFKESAFRHFMQWLADEDDEDHAAAVLYNVQGAEYVKARGSKSIAEAIDDAFGKLGV